MFGIDYFFELVLEESRQLQYQIYITDCLKGIIDFFGGEKKSAIMPRYYDIVYPNGENIVDIEQEKTPEERFEKLVSDTGIVLV